jgi:hypothetical protein
MMTIQIFCQLFFLAFPLFALGMRLASLDKDETTYTVDYRTMAAIGVPSNIAMYLTGAFDVLTFSDWLWLGLITLSWGIVVHNIARENYKEEQSTSYGKALLFTLINYWLYYEMGVYDVIFAARNGA